MLLKTPPPKASQLAPLVKICDVASLLSVSRTTVYHLIDSGDLKASPINPTSAVRKHVRVTQKSLLNLYRKRFGHCLLDALAHKYQT